MSESKTQEPSDPGSEEASNAAPVDLAEVDEARFRERALEATELLAEIYANRRLLATMSADERRDLLTVAGQVARPGPWAKRELAREVRKRRRQELRAAESAILDTTGIRAKRREAVFATPVFGPPPVPAGVSIDETLAAPPLLGDGGGARTLREERTCYVCKKGFVELHHFYDAMCPACADLNYRKRSQSADLRGRVALLTGARVKIGYQAAIMLLRAGAKVIVTTRFPRDAAARYARESDSAEWAHRLEIHGLDLRHTPSVEAFARHMLDTQDRLDFILNNACQTVRRPSGFYGHLMEGEHRPYDQLPSSAQGFLHSYEAMRAPASSEASAGSKALSTFAHAAGLQDPATLSQLALLEEDLERSTHIFPTGQLDQDLQQVDRRERNSWRLPLAEVSAVELLEVQLVNAVAPFILNARLKALMLRQPSRDKHIVNVSAMEGQFYRSFKTDKHPHTNMAKAALNMMTRTAAIDYVKDGIHMNSVDTGWITDEDPIEIAERKTAEHGFHPPLDIVDGAARICDPIFAGISSGEHQWGLFLKDYAPTPW